MHPKKYPTNSEGLSLFEWHLRFVSCEKGVRRNKRHDNFKADSHITRVGMWMVMTWYTLFQISTYIDFEVEIQFHEFFGLFDPKVCYKIQSELFHIFNDKQ